MLSPSDIVVRPTNLTAQLAAQPATPEPTQNTMAERFAPEAQKILGDDPAEPPAGPVISGYIAERASARVSSAGQGLLIAAILISLIPTAAILALLWQGVITIPGHTDAQKFTDRPAFSTSDLAAVAPAPAVQPAPEPEIVVAPEPEDAVPAKVAGVPSIALASPPQIEFGGLPHPNILALCHILGVGEVYAVGGAQAIAMFAFGVPDLCRRVDLITGPGNIYVVAAKRLLKGRVSIDAEAGPTEIAVLADGTADPVHVAADLISQAEHDPLAAAVLITDSDELAEGTQAELSAQVPSTKHVERIVQ